MSSCSSNYDASKMMCISLSRPCHFMHALHFIHSVKKELIKMLLVIRVTSIRISDDMVVGQASEWKIILTLVHLPADDGEWQKSTNEDKSYRSTRKSCKLSFFHTDFFSVILSLLQAKDRELQCTLLQLTSSSLRRPPPRFLVFHKLTSN